MPAKKSAKPIGKVTHFYDKISVGIVKFSAAVKLGDLLHFKGRKCDFVQAVNSLQFNHKSIEKAARGKEVGLKVKQKVEEGDLVFRAKAAKA